MTEAHSDGSRSSSPRPARKTLPAARPVEGRACLLVGGGAAAGRKAEALLDAGAEVVLVMTDARGCDTRAYAAFFHRTLDGGFHLPPSQFEVCAVSAAHSQADVAGLAEVAAGVLAT